MEGQHSYVFVIRHDEENIEISEIRECRMNTISPSSHIKQFQ